VYSILAAMNDMADAMTAVNASRRQVAGVAAWRDLAAASVTAGQAAGAPHAGQLAVPAAGSRTHGQWMATADAIITTLSGHAAEAEAMAAGAREEAEDARETERQANAARAQAEADELPDQAAAQARRAASAADEAEKWEEHAEACEAWAVAASDASAYGVALTVREDAVHAPVGHTVATGGGRAWIANDKHFLTGGA
jgi:hypothetical protein